MTTKREVNKVLKQNARSIVDERIVTETLDAIAEWTGELMGKLTTLEPKNEKQMEDAFKQIYEGLIAETATQLETAYKVRVRKLSK